MTEPKTLTLSDFANLESAWPEYIEGVEPHSGGKGILIARIHPSCNRPTGDEDVLVRALVYMPADAVGPAALRRLTIRRGNVEPKEGAIDDGKLLDYPKLYRKCLYTIMALPVLELR